VSEASGVVVTLTSSEGAFFDSSDGITWTSRTGATNIRVYSAKRLLTSLENTVVSRKLKEPREKLFPVRADLEEQSVRQALIQAGNVMGKQRRSYDKIKVSAPTDRIPLASFCRLQDRITGLNIKAIITGYDIEMHTHNNTIGADEVTLHLDELYSI